MDRIVFDAVQAKLTEQQNNHNEARSKTGAVLTGLLFDDAGNKMSPSHTRKDGIRYRYYVSQAHLQARGAEAGSVGRVPAIEIEAAVTEAVREHLNLPTTVSPSDLIPAHVEQVVIKPDQLWIELKLRDVDDSSADAKPAPDSLKIAWVKPPSKKRREILLPDGENRDVNMRPIRADARARLITALARGQRWLDELTSANETTAEAIAARECCSVRKVNMTVSLAFLAPDLVKAAIEGRLPRGVGIARLVDMPPEWSNQRKALGLRPY